MSLVLQQRLDRESRDAYALTLLAIDGGSPARSASVRVRINVDDVNDNAPSFSASSQYETTVTENQPISSSILQVHADDRDLGPNGQVMNTALQVISHLSLYQRRQRNLHALAPFSESEQTP